MAMTKCDIVGVSSVDLGVPDLPGSIEFYTKVWGLEVAAETPSSVYLRGASRRHHIYALHARAKAELLRVNLAAKDKQSVDVVYSRLLARGDSQVEAAPASLNEPEKGYGFSFKDSEGRTVRLVADAEVHSNVLDQVDKMTKVSHFVINSPNRDKVAQYYCDVFGLRIIDRTKFMSFLCAASDHHCIAVAQHGVNSLNHIAFETPDIDTVMRGAGRLRDNGVPIEWGVGRHGPGNNVFAYFIGPSGEVIEYTAEVNQVDENYVVRDPNDWFFPPGRMDQWGSGQAQTENFKRAQNNIPFDPGIFHPL
jgi:catechol 2,3-dioxygenase-like lactoylglutathione lyase family enzyme